MTGRGIDQILPQPGDPRLHEPLVHDARQYVELAERANGPIARPVDYAYVWGDALSQWDELAPDARIVNLETSITTSNDYWPGKEVHYRMNPANIACLVHARLSCCALANNHVLDWGYGGLAETVHTLAGAGIGLAGAGSNCELAQSPAVLALPGKGRVVVFSFGSLTSGIPPAWAASKRRAGVNLLAEFSDREVAAIQQRVAQVKQANDVIVASIHWGPNWGFEISPAQREFAHRLIDDAGVGLIHGHSSHHVQGIEVYRGRLILYGCGDFLDDYEGIGGYQMYRDDLGIMYFATLECGSAQLMRLLLVPTRIRRMRVERARGEDALWLRDTLDRESQPLGVRVRQTDQGRLEALWTDL
jgi:poly-gamma-glutamate synthesis protein (capsule biosynthesis protein)